MIVRRSFLALASASVAGVSLPARAAGIGGAFALIDHNGRPFTDRDLLGRPSAIFFGYTYCPEVCPTTLQNLGRWLRQLGPAANGLNIIYVTVDPERDTPEHMREYLTSFDPRIRGLSGTPAQIARIASAYHVYYKKVRLPGGAYAMDHSAAIYLLDRNGQFVEPIGYGENDAMALASLRRLTGGR